MRSVTTATIRALSFICALGLGVTGCATFGCGCEPGPPEPTDFCVVGGQRRECATPCPDRDGRLAFEYRPYADGDSPGDIGALQDQVGSITCHDRRVVGRALTRTKRGKLVATGRWLDDAFVVREYAADGKRLTNIVTYLGENEANHIAFPFPDRPDLARRRVRRWFSSDELVFHYKSGKPFSGKLRITDDGDTMVVTYRRGKSVEGEPADERP